MSRKIDPRAILRDHIATLSDARTERLSWWDIFFFFFLPLVVAVLMLFFNVRLDGTDGAVLITALSVFAALLFNLLLLIHSIAERLKTPRKSQLRTTLIGQVYANISYSILVAVVAIIALLVNAVFQAPWVVTTSTGFIYYLVVNFILTLLVVLKRMHLMLADGLTGDGN